MRYFRATVEYDGTDFAGFQWQHEQRTVQGVLETAIAKRTDQTIRLTGAGRTDSGVHAYGQVISFGVETRIPVDSMSLAMNTVLPADICVRNVTEVDASFSARFSASSRLYYYLILNQPSQSPLYRRYSAFQPLPLDVDAMQTAANYLLGERDFASFTNMLDVGQTTMREVTRCRVNQMRNFVVVRIEANAFLRGMVRTVVGTLIQVGAEKRMPESIREVLEARDRQSAGPSAPPQGLCLMRVRYGVRKQYSHNDGVNRT